MSGKQLTKNYIYLIISQISVNLLQLITVPYVSRVLEPEGIGIYSYAVAIMTYFSMFGTLGLNYYSQVEIAKQMNNKENRHKLFWECFFSKSITLLLSNIAFFIFISFANLPNKTIFSIVSISLIGEFFNTGWYLIGTENFMYMATIPVIIRLSALPLVFIFITQKSDLLLYVLIVQLANFFGNVLMLVPIIKEHGFKIAKNLEIKKHLINNLVYFIPTIAVTVYHALDKTMLGIFQETTVQNGYYEQASKIIQILTVVTTSLSMVVLPRVTFLEKEKKQDELDYVHNRTFQAIFLIACPLLFGIISISERFVPMFFGADYMGSVPILNILAVLVVIIGLDNLIGAQGLTARGLQKKYGIGTIIGLFCNLLLNIYFIKNYGGIGAAIASVISEFVILLCFIIFTWNYFSFRNMIKYAIRYSIYGVIMFFIVKESLLYINNTVSGLILNILIGAIVYIFILLITKDELTYLFIKAIKNKFFPQEDKI